MDLKLKSVFAVLPRTERGRAVKLDGSPDGKSMLYCHGHSVIIRKILNPELCDIYTQHSSDVLVARYSPSSFYIASADKSGKCRIWDTVNEEHILKNEFQPLSGPIHDLSWSSDNQRIVVGGEGRDKFGHVFLADTGTSNGLISGQSKPINSVQFRPKRPFKIVSGSEDNTAALYDGPPFKFKLTKTDHSSYVQVVSYSPSGDLWSTAGFDGKIFLYDANKDDNDSLLRTFISSNSTNGETGHGGGVYGMCWSPDNTSILTASGDRTCKLWDVESGKCVTTFNMGKSQFAEGSIQDQQLGCLWTKDGENLLSVSLSGRINYLDKGSGCVQMIVDGHNKPITASTSNNRNNMVTGDSEGRLVNWNIQTGEASPIVISSDGDVVQENSTKSSPGQITTQISALSKPIASERRGDSFLIGCTSYDNILRFINLESKTGKDSEFSENKPNFNLRSLKLDQQARGLCAFPGGSSSNDAKDSTPPYFMVVTFDKQLLLHQSTSDTRSAPAAAPLKVSVPPDSVGCEFEPVCLGVSCPPESSNSSKHHVAIGSGDGQMNVYEFSFEKSKFEVNFDEPLLNLNLSPGHPTSCAYSPLTESMLAVTDSNRRVHLYVKQKSSSMRVSYDKKHDKEWCFHTARVQCVTWSPDEKYLVTGALDSSIIVWNVECPSKHYVIRNAHPHSHISGVLWTSGSGSDDQIVTTGHDSIIKVWTFKFE